MVSILVPPLCIFKQRKCPHLLYHIPVVYWKFIVESYYAQGLWFYDRKIPFSSIFQTPPLYFEILRNAWLPKGYKHFQPVLMRKCSRHLFCLCSYCSNLFKMSLYAEHLFDCLTAPRWKQKWVIYDQYKMVQGYKGRDTWHE